MFTPINDLILCIEDECCVTLIHVDIDSIVVLAYDLRSERQIHHDWTISLDNMFIQSIIQSNTGRRPSWPVFPVVNPTAFKGMTHMCCYYELIFAYSSLGKHLVYL